MSDDESFKVTDRRGRSSEQAAPEPPPEATAATAADAPSAEPQEPRRQHRAAPGTRTGKADLQGLFMMFASSALIHLGDAPDPISGEQRVDLAQAQDAIDLLLLLRDKTQGNRSDLETRMLDQIVYDLQMRFVDATRR